MEKKSLSIIPLGMQKDVSVVQADQQHAFDIRNMRITVTGNNTQLCLKNEKGNDQVYFDKSGYRFNLPGIVIGSQEIQDYVILFLTHYDYTLVRELLDYDSIVKVSEMTDTVEDDSKHYLKVEYLYKGDLGFREDHPIQSIGIYENENIQKVYWVDGINSPRVINICKTYTNDDPSQFDFIPIINNVADSNDLSVAINTIHNTNAAFSGGVIQYAISYFNKYGQQSPVIYQSPLYYTSDNGRGLNPDGTQRTNTAFEITIENISQNWEYLRVYRIIRTTLNDTPSVEYIASVKTGESYTKNTSISSITSNGNFQIKYGEDSAYADYESIWDLFYGIIGKIEYGNPDYANIVLVNYNPLNPTNKPLYIRYINEDKTIEYIIPKNKIVKLIWDNSTTTGLLKESFMITIADSEDPYNYISNEFINGTITKIGSLIIDTGTTGTSVDPSELLFLESNDLIASTIEHKDGTLFLGNINLEKSTIPLDVKKDIKDSSSLQFKLLDINNSDRFLDLDIQWNPSSNLLKNSSSATFFQKGEVYRFGVQFLSKKGIWSEVVYLGDLENNIRVVPNKYNDNILKKPTIQATIDVSTIKEDYIAAKLVCVYPTITDRNVLCQGIVCPTVYNVKDRNDNSPYVQSSWFARPSYSRPNDFNTAYMAGIGFNNVFHKGAPLEWRMVNNHNSNYPIVSLPSSVEYNSEIFCSASINPLEISYDDDDREVNIENYKNIFGVEKRIVTMHSPELDDAYSEELNTINLGNVKFRVIGYAPVKTTFSDVNIVSENLFVPEFSGMYNAYVQSPSSSVSKSISGYSLVNFPMWIDGVAVGTDETTPGYAYSNRAMATFPIYPWHRKGSLSNQGKTTDSNNRKSLLKSKTMSNLRICLPTAYLSSDKEYTMEISNVEVWNSTETTNTIKKLNTSSLWNIQSDVIYKGDIDKVLACEGDASYDESFIPIQQFKWGKGEIYSEIPNNFEYPHSDLNIYRYINDSSIAEFTSSLDKVNKQSSDPIPMQYRSTGHAVFAFGKTKKSSYEMLPVIISSNYNDTTTETCNVMASLFSSNYWLSNEEIPKEDPFMLGLYQHSIQCEDDRLDYTVHSWKQKDKNAYGYYFIIGELYRDNVQNRFGGTSEQALASNIWTTCGDIVYFNDTSNITLIGTQGDTYLSRYDHLKTYPLGEGKVNNIVDIVSFMCETRINIDGRYDRNRGLQSNLHITPNNFNLFNKVYSQRNNFFTSSYLRADDLFSTKFPSQVMWTKTKTLGEEIDSWTNILATSVLDLDGDKGELVSLTKYGNELFAFQEQGISRILYNNRVQIQASDGIPIEIANSGKVEGKVYLPYNYGCQNKWSIVKTPGGLYFIDNYNNAILCMGPDGSLVDLSTTKGMASWVNSFKEDYDYSWKPSYFNSIKSIYDPATKDIYFTTSSEALAFNEVLGKFTSFYSYERVPYLFTIKGSTYQIQSNIDMQSTSIWKMHSNTKFNNFFGNNKDYSVSIIANPEFSADKIFDTIEFRTNDTSTIKYGKASYYPFNTLKVENEYQSSKASTKTLKKKFRTWRWQVGRDDKKGRDRIRNPWAKFTLEGDSNDELKVYDMNVIYYT